MVEPVLDRRERDRGWRPSGALKGPDRVAPDMAASIETGAVARRLGLHVPVVLASVFATTALSFYLTATAAAVVGVLVGLVAAAVVVLAASTVTTA